MALISLWHTTIGRTRIWLKIVYNNKLRSTAVVRALKPAYCGQRIKYIFKFIYHNGMINVRLVVYFKIRFIIIILTFIDNDGSILIARRSFGQLTLLSYCIVLVSDFKRILYKACKTSASSTHRNENNELDTTSCTNTTSSDHC